MLEPSSFLNSSIVGFFSLDFSHGLNDNPHKKTFPYLFHTHADCIVIIILLRGFVMTKMEICQGVFLWVSLTFRGLTILGLGRMDYYFKEIVSTTSSSCVKSCFFSYCLHCSYETKLKALIGCFGFFHLRLIP